MFNLVKSSKTEVNFTDKLHQGMGIVNISACPAQYTVW